MSVTIHVSEFMSELSLEALVAPEESITFTIGEINRPGLQFTGYYEHFQAKRVQLVGNAEMYYLYALTDEDIADRMRHFMSFGVPCIVCARGNQPPEVMIECARRYKVPMFRSMLPTGTVSHQISEYLETRLAPRILKHGVLMDVFGVGVLLMGDSGMGKSETALEMIKAGHRLIADDVVQIVKTPDRGLVGEAPEATRHLMEVRGIGIIDVRYLYGVGAVIARKHIDLVMEMEMWNENAHYERIGASERYMEILGIKVPSTVLPVSPGRNLAVVIEVAARNFRLKRMGYDIVKSGNGERIRSFISDTEDN